MLNSISASPTHLMITFTVVICVFALEAGLIQVPQTLVLPRKAPTVLPQGSAGHSRALIHGPNSTFSPEGVRTPSKQPALLCAPERPEVHGARAS